MTTISLLAAAGPTRLDPVELFLDADIVVQLVMAGLLLASIWVWMIIVGFGLRMGRLNGQTKSYEEDFWQAENFDRFMSERGRKDLPPARVANAGVAEWRRSTRDGVKDRDGVRQRLGGPAELPRHGRVGRALRGPVRDGLGHHEQLLPDRRAGKLLAGRGGAGYFRSALRHRDRALRRHPGGDRL